MSVTTQPCAGCTAPVTREDPDTSTKIGQLMAKLPFYCDPCIDKAKAADRIRAEVEAIDRQREMHESRVRRSGLPAHHYRTLDELDHSPTVLDAARAWVAGGRGLLLTGEIGRGKTTVAGAATWMALERGLVVWASAPLLLARLGSGLGTEGRDWAVDVLANRHGLVLDDIDKARPTEYGAEQVFLAVDQRIEHEQPLLVTSNLAPSQLAERWPEPYGPAIASRLVGYCKVVRVEGRDRRLGEGS